MLSENSIVPLNTQKITDSIEIKIDIMNICSRRLFIGNSTILISVKKIDLEILQISGKPDIYYAGAKEQWDKIEKEYNAVFEKAEIHYNSNPDEN